MNIQPWFLHIDLDAFFASVEQMDNPEYRGKPVIVGGMPGERRSVVSTCSYEARKYGVHSAMPVFQAHRLCPDGIYVHPRMKRYAELSYKVMSIFQDYSPDVQQMSIDEAFLDITGTEGLFGPPEETARKIKERVRNETGLTVSVGLAPTKYLAKIASDMNKPDGLYIIQPGKEQDFMLSIPLKKVFGIGKKSQEKLKKSGFNTTRDIFNQPLDVLNFIFGQNQGTFLYNAVRGLETETFSSKPKSHSISSETTFYDDISDLYTLETKLLELCHGIMFRLIKDQCFSKTIMIKIRYEDFTTVSIQRTYDKNILIIDDLYAKAKSLLEEKINSGTSVRLLGLGFENITDKEKDIQLELFDDGTEKKQAVEKAILNLEQKHPEIKIQKARLLETGKTIEGKKNHYDFSKIKNVLIFLSALTTASLFSNKLSAQSNTVESQGAAALVSDTISEESDSIDFNSLFFQWENPVHNVDFELSGFWNINLSGSLNSSFGFGNPFIMTASLPVFKQETDFYTVANITDHWYFYMNFLDNFNNNTYTLGYKKPDSYFNSFKFSNRGISFPEYYAGEILGYGASGGNTQSPGFSFNFADFETHRWNSDFILRYDMTQLKSAVFYGHNAVSESKINLENYLKGKIFLLPEKNAAESIFEVYVQSDKGDTRDSYGRKMRLLNNTEYYISPERQLLVIGAIPEKAENKTVSITFSSDSGYQTFLNAAGSPDNPDSFTGKVQSYFNSNNTGRQIKLSDYIHDFETAINGKKAIVLKAGDYFSPFEYTACYDLGITGSSQTECGIFSRNSEKQNMEYIVESLNSMDYLTSTTSLFQENHTYVEIQNNVINEKEITSPERSFPFGNLYPEIYLNHTNPSDLVLSKRTYTQINNFDIGKKAAASTVRVYINGILDPLAKYDSESGFVTLSSAISRLDKIYITWQEEASENFTGAVIAAGGLNYLINPYLKTNLEISSRLPFTPGIKYSQNEDLKNSYISLASSTEFTWKNLTVKDTAGISVQNPDMTGVYLAAAADETVSETSYLGITSGYKTKTNPVLKTSDSILLLTAQNNYTVDNYTGKTDSQISGYKIPVSFDFTGASQNETLWAAEDIKLTDGNLLYKSSQFEIAIKPDSELKNYDVYLQLGIKAEDDFSGEDGSKISCWKITSDSDAAVSAPLDTENPQWQIVKIQLNNSDRSKLLSCYDCRLIIVKDNYDSQTEPAAGTVWVGPYQAEIQNLFIQNNILSVQTWAEEEKDSPFYKNYGNSKQQYNLISWNSYEGILSDYEKEITASSYFPQKNTSDYRLINLDFKIADASAVESITLLLEDAQSSVNLKAKLSADYLTTLDYENWHNLTINTLESKVYIDNISVPSDLYSVYYNPDVLPVKQTVTISLENKSATIKKGELALGKLYFTDTNSYLEGNNRVSVSIENKDSILKIKKYDLLKNGYAKVQSRQTGTYTDAIKSLKGNLDFSGNAGFTLAGISVSGDLSGKYTGKTSFLNAGHTVKTENPVFSLLSFEENYRFNPEEKISEKFDSINLNFNRLHIPLSMNFNSTAKENLQYISQVLAAGIKSDFSIGNTGFTFYSNLELSQKDNSVKFNENYGNQWLRASQMQFSTGNKDAVLRKEKLTSSFSTKIKPLNFNPELKSVLESTCKNSTSTVSENYSELGLKLPFTISSNNLSLNITRKNYLTSPQLNNINYITDSRQFFNTQNVNIWFYKAIPVYDLFDKNLPAAIKASSKDNYYCTDYTIQCKRKFSNSLQDFYLPQTSQISFSREIKTATTISDLYQIKATATLMSLNLFGKQGALKFFKFYNQDEFTSSYTAAIKIPKNAPADTVFQMALYNSVILFMPENKNLKLGYDLSVETNRDWLLRGTAAYSTKASYSPLLIITDFLLKNKENPDYKITRKEVFIFNTGQLSNLFTLKMNFNHNCEVQFLKNYTITSGAGLGLDINENKAVKLNLDYTIGARLKF